MSFVRCADALIYWNGSPLPASSSAVLEVDADIVSAKHFVESIAVAYSEKAMVWKDWNLSTKNYYDDNDNSIFDDIQSGQVGEILVYPSRASTQVAFNGTATITSLEKTINSEDYSELQIKFRGSNKLHWDVGYLLRETGDYLTLESLGLIVIT